MSDEQNHDEHVEEHNEEHVEAPVEAPKDERNEFQKLQDDVKSVFAKLAEHGIK